MVCSPNWLAYLGETFQINDGKSLNAFTSAVTVPSRMASRSTCWTVPYLSTSGGQRYAPVTPTSDDL